MKVLILRSSPRKDGNSNLLADAFASRMQELGQNVTSVSVTGLKIEPCCACNGCTKAGRCVKGDDFQFLSEKLVEADIVAVVSPVYWYSFPAEIKAVIDRFYSLYVNGKLFTNKKTVLISVCEEETPTTFEGICFSYRKTMELMGATLAGEVLVPGVYDIGDVLRTDGIERVKKLADSLAAPAVEQNHSVQLTEDDRQEPEGSVYLTESKIRNAAERWICRNRIYVVPEEDGPECYVIGPDLADWLEYDIMDLWDSLDWNGAAYQAMNADDLLDMIHAWAENSTEQR